MSRKAAPWGGFLILRGAVLSRVYMGTIQFALLAVFPALMALAAAYDLLTMTIPNRIPLAIIAAFAIAAAFAGFDLTLFGWHLLGAAVVFVICFGMFALGWIGGGDAKLAVAIAFWTGPFLPLLNWAIAAAIYGGVLTLAILAVRRVPMPLVLLRQDWIARLHDKTTGIPYGIALAAAGLSVFPTTEIFTRVAG